MYPAVRLIRQTRSFCAALFIVAPTLAGAQSPGSTDRDRDAAALVRAMSEQLLATAPHAGLSVAIGRDSGVVFAEGFGFADVAAQRRVTAATRFRAASVSKVITTTALGRLMQEGRIDLDAPVQRYVPAFPEKQWPITARQLAGHLSGLPHYTPADRTEPRFYSSVGDALTVFSHLVQMSEPGATYRYSTHGYTLLSAAIEGAAGEPFLDYVSKAVLQPLAMQATAPDLRAAQHPELTRFYTLRDTGIVALEQTEDPSYKWAGGGLTSTPSDLVRLGLAYVNGFLRADVVEELWRSQRLKSGSETGVGLGWRNGRDAAGRRAIEHAGSMQGTRSVVSIFPEQRIAVAVMANREWSSHIESTAHMLALPYLDPRPRGRGLTGSAIVSVELTSPNFPARRVEGQLTLRDGRGTLVADGVTYQLLHVAAGDVYALVRAAGIYHTTISVANGQVTGRALSYSSPQLGAATAFLSFSGSFR